MSSKQSFMKRRAEILDGNRIAAEIKREVKDAVTRLAETSDVQPCLVAIRVGDDPASSVYVRNKVRVSQELGLKSEHLALLDETTTEELLATIEVLNGREDVDGILLQLPLPAHVDERRVLERVNPGKDVDGFHPVNIGRLILNQPTLLPCTPAGIIELLKRSNIPLSGARACVVGRSHIVGPPRRATSFAGRCDRHRLPFAHKRSRFRHLTGGYSRRRHRSHGAHSGRAHQTGRNRR